MSTMVEMPGSLAILASIMGFWIVYLVGAKMARLELLAMVYLEEHLDIV